MSLDEQWKYEKAYQLESYHLQGQRELVVMADVAALPPGSSYLDVGCGRGESVARARALGIDAWGTEYFSEILSEFVVFADIEALPFEDGRFEYVSCYDVLEHLTPGTEQRALDELGRVCATQLTLSTNDKNSFLPTGEDLHVNKRPMLTWHADIVERWGAENVAFSTFGYGSEQWKWQVQMAR